MLTAEWMTELDFQHSRKMMLNCSGIAEVTHLWQCVRPPVSTSCRRPASVSCEGKKPTNTYERHTWRWMIGSFEQVTGNCSSKETRQTFALVNWSSSKTAIGKLWKATLILRSGASKCTVAPPTTSPRLKKAWRAQVIWTQFCFIDQLFLIKRFCLVFLLLFFYTSQTTSELFWWKTTRKPNVTETSTSAWTVQTWQCVAPGGARRKLK